MTPDDCESPPARADRPSLSFAACTAVFAFAGAWFGVIPGLVIDLLGGPARVWMLPGILGGVVAGFALGLSYAFLRRPAVDREYKE